jgi:hypothetical protein
MEQILIDIVPVGVQQQWLFGRIQIQVGFSIVTFQLGQFGIYHWS